MANTTDMIITGFDLASDEATRLRFNSTHDVTFVPMVPNLPTRKVPIHSAWVSCDYSLSQQELENFINDFKTTTFAEAWDVVLSVDCDSGDDLNGVYLHSSVTLKG